MPASYPPAIKTFTQLVDGVDDVLALHPNERGDEITAIETELGTNPRGTATDVKARLDAAHTAGGLHTLKIATGDLIDANVTEPKLGAAAVAQAKLKTALAEASQSADHIPTLIAGGEYAFGQHWKRSAAGFNWVLNGVGGPNVNVGDGYVGTSYSGPWFTKSGGGTVSAQNRYVTASGRDHWLFLLLAIADYDHVIDGLIRQRFKVGDIIAGWQAPDHPCHGTGFIESELSHPFGAVDPARHLVVLADNAVLAQLRTQVTRRRSLLTVVHEDYLVDVDSKPTYAEREIIDIDQIGDRPGQVLGEFATPEFAKAVIPSDVVQLKRRLVVGLPASIVFKQLRRKI